MKRKYRCLPLKMSITCQDFRFTENFFRHWFHSTELIQQEFYRIFVFSDLIHQTARQRMTSTVKHQGQPRRLRTAYTNTQVGMPIQYTAKLLNAD
jgi:hypothetical protein